MARPDSKLQLCYFCCVTAGKLLPLSEPQYPHLCDGQTANSSNLTVGQGTQAVTSSSDSGYYPVCSKMNLELFVIRTQETTGLRVKVAISAVRQRAGQKGERN